jgi:cell division protein FtsW
MTEFSKGKGKRKAAPNAKPLRLNFNPPGRVSMPMLILTLFLITFGLIMLFSASMSVGYTYEKNPLFYIMKQGQFTLLGIVVIIVLTFIPVKWYDHIPFVTLAYAVTLGLVIYTKFKGTIRGGSRRWISIGGQEFQPSELAKIALIFCIAGYRSFIVKLRKNGHLRLKSARAQSYLDCTVDIVIPVILLMICLVFVFLQPHMSFFIIMLILSFICLLVSGIPLKSWIDGGLILLLTALLGGVMFMSFTTFEQKDDLLGNYQHVFTRLDIFATQNETAAGDTAADTKETPSASDDEVYQSRQSMIAIGSGGLQGVGFGESRQKYQYLPAAHNDYVYAIICEELGFVGGVSVILLFLAFLIGGLYIAWHAKSDFARILAVGYTCLIVVQAFFNIGVSIGVIPPTGITLPFFSYGGTADLFFLGAAGILLGISKSGVDHESKSKQEKRNGNTGIDGGRRHERAY